MLTARLYALQQVDSAVAGAVARRHHLDDGTAQRDLVDQASARLEAAQSQLKQDHGRLRALELEIQTLQAKRVKIERDMYSGRIANPKELSAMQGEVAAFGRLQGAREDDVLQLMMQTEALDADAKAAEQQLAAAQADLDRIVTTFADESASLDRQIAELTARRGVLAAEIDEHVLRRYERLLPAKGGQAVAVVRRGVCEGCHVAVPQRVVSRLERDPDLIATCDECGRILVVHHETPPLP